MDFSADTTALPNCLGNHPAFADLKLGDTVTFTEEDIAALYTEEMGV